MGKHRHVLSVLALATCLSLIATSANADGDARVVQDTRKVDAPGGNPTDQTVYTVITGEDVVSLRESNGVFGQGVVDDDLLPPAYRALLPAVQRLAVATTGAQLHATCDAGALTETASVLAWQTVDAASGPAYGYIPFQRTSAGVGDDPADWIGHVRTLTGVNLATVSDPAAACGAIGGTYHAADVVISGAAERRADSLAATLRKLLARPLTVTAASRRFAPSATVMVTGRANSSAVVRLLVSAKEKRRLGLGSPTLVSKKVRIGSTGAALLTVTPSAAARRAVDRANRAVPVKLEVRAGAAKKSRGGVLVG